MKSNPLAVIAALFGTIVPGAAVAVPAPVVSLKADAIQGVAPGGAVGEWRNSGGTANGINAESPAGSAPHLAASAINNLPAVHFNASAHQFLSMKRPVQDDFTIICVFRSTQGIGNGAAFFAGAGLVQGEVSGAVSDFGMSLNALGQVCVGTGFPDVSWASKGGYNDGKPHIATMTRAKSAGVVALYVDSAPNGTVTGGTQALVAPTRIGIGALSGGGSFLDGDIAEVEIYAAALSDAERKSVEAALKAKWGIG